MQPRQCYAQSIRLYCRVDGVRAEVYRRCCQNSMILSLEAEARAARRSLWQDVHPTVPQCWRNHAEKGHK
jgi:hypothetical protein